MRATSIGQGDIARLVLAGEQTVRLYDPSGRSWTDVSLGRWWARAVSPASPSPPIPTT